MAHSEIQSRIEPWLRRWSLEDQVQTDAWVSNMSLGTYDTDDYLVHVGERSDTLYLLESGLVRLFYTTPDGRERNKAFYRAGQVTGPVSAAITASPAPFSIQCLEPTEAIRFRFGDLLAATEHNPAISRLYREMLAEAFIRNEQREAVLLTCNAEQRYQWLVENEPDLPERVAQFHIASYLGVDAVSLSRLKRKLRE
jgi:CRP-like cAMP-binding protein